jgi:hypothetical protein
MNAMMKKTGILLLALGLIVGTSSCIMEDRVVQFVLHNGTCEEFPEYSTSTSFVTPVTVNYANEINNALADNDIDKNDIVTARLVSATYEVTDFSQSHDWVVGGSVTVERTDIGGSQQPLFDYLNQAIADSVVGRVIRVDLDDAGVAVVNQALDDFIVGGVNGNPVFIIRVNNGSVSPTPTSCFGSPGAYSGHRD